MSHFQTFSPVVNQDEEGKEIGGEEELTEGEDGDEGLETETSTDDEEI